MTVLASSEIIRRIQASPPLVAEYLDLETQVQPNGFDLTLRGIDVLQTPGTLAVSNAERVLPVTTPLVFDGMGYIDLPPGAYRITFNEVVNLPHDLMAIARSRSSLLRSGVVVSSAVWDAGYSGRSESLMVVYHPHGFRVQRNTRLLQLVFMTLCGQTDGYQGVYQGENLTPETS
jgi:dUTP pyrophosphatase